MGVLIDILNDIWAFILYAWGILIVIWSFLDFYLSKFGLTFIIEFALFLITEQVGFVLGVAEWLGAQEIVLGVTFVKDTLQSNFMADLYGIAAWLIDWIVPAQLANQVLGSMVVLWLLGYIINLIVWIWRMLPFT